MQVKAIKDLFGKYGIVPTKFRGQNFLISEKVLEQIIDAAELSRDDMVLEIGSGLGVLTQALVKHVGYVVGVETDQKFYKILKELFKDSKNLELIQDDILKFSLKDFYRKTPRSWSFAMDEKLGEDERLGEKEARYKLVSNIPYNITSEILIKFLSEEPQPQLMVLMIQKEVAERIVEKDKKSSRLSIFVNYFGKPEIVAKVSASCFWPQPKVDSAILKIETRDGIYKNDKKREKAFFNLVKLGFSHPRKKLLSNLNTTFDRPKLEQSFRGAEIELNVRPENLNFSNWKNLFEEIIKRG